MSRRLLFEVEVAKDARIVVHVFARRASAKHGDVLAFILDDDDAAAHADKLMEAVTLARDVLRKRRVLDTTTTRPTWERTR